MSQPQWAPFLAVVALLTIAVLALARQSQRLVREYGPDGDSDDPGAGGASIGGDTGESGEPSPVDGGGSGEPTPVGGGESGGPTPVDGSESGGPTPVDGDRSREQATEGGGKVRGRAGQEPEIELTTGALLANVAVTQGLVAVVVLAAVWYFSIPADAIGVTAAPSSTGVAAVAIGLGFGVALWAGNELSTRLADVVGAAYDERVRGMLAPDSAVGWIALFGVVLPIIAASEELLFRAAIVGVPAAGFAVSPWLLAAVSSVAFAIGHGAQGRVGIVVTGALGFVLAAGYVVTGSLLLVIVAHYVVNALEFLLHELLAVPWLESASAPS